MITDYSDSWGSSTKWKRIFFQMMDNWWKSEQTKAIIAKGSKRYKEADLTDSISKYLPKRLKQYEITNLRPREDSHIPDIRVRTQSGLHTNLSEDVFEVKKGMAKTGEADRLFGQISNYCERYGHCFVVICGGEIKHGYVTEVYRHSRQHKIENVAIWTPEKNLRF